MFLHKMSCESFKVRVGGPLQLVAACSPGESILAITPVAIQRWDVS